jgi:hypothetical protein
VVLEERAREALDARYDTGAVQTTAVLTLWRHRTTPPAATPATT